MNRPTHAAEQLREEMRQLRSHMDSDVDSFVENTRVLLDWHSYFRSAPWLCLGGAALAGYLIVPSKARSVSVDLQHLAEAAKHRQVLVTDRGVQAKETVGSSLAKVAAGILWKAALAVAMQQLNQFLSPRPPGSPGGRSPGSQSPAAQWPAGGGR
jgi:hypothetical protein